MGCCGRGVGGGGGGGGLVDGEAGVDFRGYDAVHLVGAVPMYEGTERVELLEWVTLAAECHPAHLPSKSVD